MRGVTASPSNTRDRFWAEGYTTWIWPNMLVVSENTRQKQKRNGEGNTKPIGQQGLSIRLTLSTVNLFKNFIIVIRT